MNLFETIDTLRECGESDIKIEVEIIKWEPFSEK